MMPAASRVITQRLKGSGPDMRLAIAEPTVPRGNELRAFYGVSGGNELRFTPATVARRPMSAAGPPQGANCSPSGGSAAARAASVGAHQ
jgi:hypothetical protein